MKKPSVAFNATNGESLPPCNREIYKTGKVVCVSLFGKDITEFVVLKIAEMGHRIDWHYHRNRAIVKAIGDIDQIRRLWWDFITANRLDAHWRGK